MHDHGDDLRPDSGHGEVSMFQAKHLLLPRGCGSLEEWL